jgi:hypothetical protein
MDEFYRNCERVKRNIRENKKDVEGLIVLGICGFTFSVIWNYADNIRLCN